MKTPDAPASNNNRTDNFRRYRDPDHPPFQPNDYVTLTWGRKNSLWVVSLTRRGAKFLRDHFADTPDDELIRQLGAPISYATFRRLVAKMHLRKSKAYMQRIQAYAVERSRIICTAFGIYEAMRGKPIPGHEKHAFKPGQSRRDRYGDEKEAAICAKISKTRRALIRRERLRILSGEPQRTRLLLTRDKPAYNARARLIHTYHYRPTEPGTIAPTTFTWDEHTTRRPKLEERYAQRHHFQFIPPLEAEPSESVTSEPSHPWETNPPSS